MLQADADMYAVCCMLLDAMDVWGDGQTRPRSIDLCHRRSRSHSLLVDGTTAIGDAAVEAIDVKVD
jgi:hypothetical protein